LRNREINNKLKSKIEINLSRRSNRLRSRRSPNSVRLYEAKLSWAESRTSGCIWR